MKTIGICLLVIGGFIFLGLSVHWHFNDWQIFDWILIIFNIGAGVYLIRLKKVNNLNSIEAGKIEAGHFLPLDLLEVYSGKPSPVNIDKNKEIIQRTLHDFGIEVTMGDVNIGPRVTQYTLEPADGVKFDQIAVRRNDISIELAAHPIRIEAPIPGKSIVGLEIPNKIVATVSLRDILENEEFKKSHSNLTLALGRDVTGRAVTSDLKQIPHILIAGATGSGKSVFINSMILSLLYQNSPKDLRLILDDAKRVEFTHYNGIPYLLSPVIFDVDKTVLALRWLTAEMDRRFHILAENHRKNIDDYNQNKPIDKMPHIVMFVDEMADVMAQVGKECESAIVRLAKMSRAVGIHLVMATARPSNDVITDKIKAVIPGRIAFAVASQIDSQRIIDTIGAERLLGGGDMLYRTNESGYFKRVQAPMVTDKEVDKVTDFLKTKSLYTASDLGIDESLEDELYSDAREVAVTSKKASTALLQRRLKVGYARAARLLDMLEKEGVIGPADGAKPRDVLVNK